MITDNVLWILCGHIQPQSPPMLCTVLDQVRYRPQHSLSFVRKFDITCVVLFHPICAVFTDPSLGVQMYYDPVNVWCEEPSKVDCGERPICDANDQNCQVCLLFSCFCFILSQLFVYFCSQPGADHARPGRLALPAALGLLPRPGELLLLLPVRGGRRLPRDLPHRYADEN